MLFIYGVHAFRFYFGLRKGDISFAFEFYDF